MFVGKTIKELEGATGIYEDLQYQMGIVNDMCVHVMLKLYLKRLEVIARASASEFKTLLRFSVWMLQSVSAQFCVYLGRDNMELQGGAIWPICCIQSLDGQDGPRLPKPSDLGF